MDNRKWIPLLYSGTIFLGAFLLFFAEPLLGKLLLPRYGGSAMVWLVALMVYQILLLGGYGYIALLRRTSKKRQIQIHIGLLLISLLQLPLRLHTSQLPTNPPPLSISLNLILSIGLPFMLLASTSPLLQNWLREQNRISSYYLYAVSNTASLIALLVFPFLSEPLLSLKEHRILWSIGFAFFVVGMLYIARRAWHTQIAPGISNDQENPVTTKKLIPWIGFGFLGTGLLYTVTYIITQDIAPVPFLWILPLVIYLVTFILVFINSRWYVPRFYEIVFICATLFTSWLLNIHNHVTFLVQICIYGLLLFTGCMIAHGELARRKPEGENSIFYFCISLGGGIGGIFCTLAAPLLFAHSEELHIIMAVLLIYIAQKSYGHRQEKIRTQYSPPRSLVIAGCCISILLLGRDILLRQTIVTHTIRNFYGTIKITEQQSKQYGKIQSLVYGNIVHGSEVVDIQTPTTYYSATSGIGTLFTILDSTNQSKRVGIIGLGVGTLAFYGNQNDVFTFYEINPAVTEIARSSFHYLKNARPSIEVLTGDARLTLTSQPRQNFNLLVLDAFSGDAIPVHLLTKEAFELYTSHIAPDGILAIHISNKYLDLTETTRSVALTAGLSTITYEDKKIEDELSGPSIWIIAGQEKTMIRYSAELQKPIDPQTWKKPWTDDYSNVFSTLR